MPEKAYTFADREGLRASDPALDPDPLPGQPRPRCPVCFSLSCPQCHRADAVVTIYDFPPGSWHHVCQRCSIGFDRD